MSTERPIGQRFSHVYLERGEVNRDSKKMRRRLGAALARYYPDDFGRHVKEELGEVLGDCENFALRADLADLLDSITIAFKVLSSKTRARRTWEIDPPIALIRQIERIFREENTPYQMDTAGGVHLYVDKEFAHSNASTIANLDIPRYANAADAFTRGLAALEGSEPSGKEAVRAVFQAAEGLFKVIFPKQNVLGRDEITNALVPALRDQNNSDQAAQVAARLMARSFSEWVAAAHQYRHEPGTEEIAEVPLSLAVLMVSQGASYIRWLIELDRSSHKETDGAVLAVDPRPARTRGDTE